MNTVTGLAEGTLPDGHESAQAKLHGIGAQGAKKFGIDVFGVASGEVGHLKHDAGILEHRPEAAGALNVNPGFVGSGAETFLPEEVLAQLASAPTLLKAGDERFPGLLATARYGESQVAEVSDYE